MSKTEEDDVKIFFCRSKNVRFNRFVESLLNGCCICCLIACLELD